MANGSAAGFDKEIIRLLARRSIVNPVKRRVPGRSFLFCINQLFAKDLGHAVAKHGQGLTQIWLMGQRPFDFFVLCEQRAMAFRFEPIANDLGGHRDADADQEPRQGAQTRGAEGAADGAHHGREYIGSHRSRSSRQGANAFRSLIHDAKLIRKIGFQFLMMFCRRCGVGWDMGSFLRMLPKISTKRISVLKFAECRIEKLHRMLMGSGRHQNVQTNGG